MNKIIVHIIFLLLTFHFCHSQSFEVSGTIKDSANNQIEGATVIIYDSNNNMVSYTISDQQGNYSMESEILTTEIKIEVSHIAYHKQSKVIEQSAESKKISLDFTLFENTDSLEEVVILSANKENDTVKLDLKKLNLYEDSSLKDILGKIPNFKLGNNGSIIYKGKSIDKILINKKESFVNQNNIALESIENRLIQNIDVINNYSDNYSLDFEEIEETVLNIDTRQSNQSVISATSSVQYGIKEKYEIKNKGLWFSRNLNSFFTSNLNNIGNKIINYKEINEILDENIILSPYQRKSLNSVFDQNENLKKDFFTTNNITLRRKGERTKISSALYFISPSRIESLNNSLTTLDNQPILDQTIQEELKATTFLGNTRVAYKLSERTIFSYQLNASLNNLKNESDISNTVFQSDETNNSNTVLSNSSIDTYAFSNSGELASKIRKDLIVRTSINFYNEESNIYNDYQIEENLNFQDLNYRKNQYKLQSHIEYNLNSFIIPKLSIDYSKATETIEDQNTTILQASRDTPNFITSLNLVGQDVLTYFDYDFNFSMDYLENELQNFENTSLFFPMDLSLNYENKLNRLSFSYSVNRALNDLQSGINRIESFNKNVLGNQEFLKSYNELKKFKSSYNYNDLFNGTSFSINFNYLEYNDILKNNFLKTEKGISFLGTFIAEKSIEREIRSNFSRTLFQTSYPLKADLNFSYKNERYPNIVNENSVQIDNTILSPSIQFQTNTKHLFNYSLHSNFSFINYAIGANLFEARYNTNSLSLHIKDERWEGKLTLVYDHNKIDEQIYTRKNINARLAYNYEKFTFSINARHLGELFSFIDNTAYNSQINIINGINSLTINNQSLNYLLIGITYKF